LRSGPGSRIATISTYIDAYKDRVEPFTRMKSADDLLGSRTERESIKITRH